MLLCERSFIHLIYLAGFENTSLFTNICRTKCTVQQINGNPVTNNQVKFKFSLIYQSATASPVFVEELNPMVWLIYLGEGTVVNGTFSDVTQTL